MTQKDSIPLAVCLVDVDTEQAVRHLFTLVESHNFHVVSFVATLHQFEKGFRIIERVADLGY